VARYTAESKERVREAADFLELVSAHTDLRRSGPNRYMGLCPFHEERTPSFSVDPDRKLYHCFGCGASGDIFGFVEATQQVDFKGALEYLAQRYGVELEVEGGDRSFEERRRARLYSLLERAASFYERHLAAASGELARAYLAGRGIGAETVKAFRIGWAPPAWDSLCRAATKAGFSAAELEAAGLALAGRGKRPYDRFRARIVFPLCDERGRVIGFGGRLIEGEGPKYLNSPEGELYHKGRHLYAYHLAREEAARRGYVILCEGYMDVVALHQAGLRNAVALMGTALTERQVRALARLARRVVLALDGDSAGQRAALRAAALARESNLSMEVVPLPKVEGRGLDPAEVIEREGPGGFARLLESTVTLERFEVERVLERHDLQRAEGKDRAIAELAGLLSALPPGNLRTELVALVAERLGGMPVPVLERLLVSSRPAGSRQPARRVVGKLLSARQRAERAFLASCLAVPEEGERALAQLDLERHLTDPLLQRVAAFLRQTDLRDPAAHADELAREEEAALAGIIAEAQALREVAVVEGEGEAQRLARLRGALETNRLQLELALLSRQIEAARRRGEEVGPLSVRLAKVKAAFDEAHGRLHGGPALVADSRR